MTLLGKEVSKLGYLGLELTQGGPSILADWCCRESTRTWLHFIFKISFFPVRFPSGCAFPLCIKRAYFDIIKTMKKTSLFIVLLFFLIVGFNVSVSAQDSSLPAVSGVELPAPGITPDNPLYFLKIWKESIQTFFTFGAENKAKQFLHLAEVRLAEYQKMIEKGKTEIAEKTIEKYQNQLNRVLEKTEQVKEKEKDVGKLKEIISEKIIKHQEILNQVLKKAPEQTQKGIKNTFELFEKEFEINLQSTSKENKEIEEVCIQVIISAIDPKTNTCKEFPTPCDVPPGWNAVNKCPSVSVAPVPSVPSKSKPSSLPPPPVSSKTPSKPVSPVPSVSSVPPPEPALAPTPAPTLVLNLPPVITEVTGPDTLEMYETGNWTVKASDPEQKVLTYSVSWGEDYMAGGITQMAPKSADYVQSSTFSHGYFKDGTYNLIFTVADEKGLSVKSNVSVNIKGISGAGFVRFELLDSSLCSPCSIGTICAACPPVSARRILNAKITVYDEKGNFIAAKDVPADGLTAFEDLPYGKYTAAFSAPGFESDSILFWVGLNMGTDNAVNLKKSSAVE